MRDKRDIKPHTSVSQIRLYAQCPWAFHQKYCAKVEPDAGADYGPRDLGIAVHSACEMLVQRAIDEEIIDEAIPCADLAELWSRVWSAHDMTDPASYTAGLEMLTRFVADQTPFDSTQVLAVERRIEMPINDLADSDVLIGYIDRIDRCGARGLRVIDYKTGRALMTRNELDNDLQASVYAAAAYRLWPWCESISVEFWGLKQGTRQRTERTREQCEHAMGYVRTMVRRIDGEPTEGGWPTRISSRCTWCDYTSTCQAHEMAMGDTIPIGTTAPSDLDEAATERQTIVARLSILNARKKTLDAALRSAVEAAEDGELLAGGYKYTVGMSEKVSYPMVETIEAIANLGGGEWGNNICKIDPVRLKSRLDGFKETMEPEKFERLEVAIAMQATRWHTPRFMARRVETAK